MSIWVGIAGLILIVAVAAISRAIQLRGERRRDKADRPVYETCNPSALADWYTACEKSLAWSRKRRNKEII